MLFWWKHTGAIVGDGWPERIIINRHSTLVIRTTVFTLPPPCIQQLNIVDLEWCQCRVNSNMNSHRVRIAKHRTCIWFRTTHKNGQESDRNLMKPSDSLWIWEKIRWGIRQNWATSALQRDQGRRVPTECDSPPRSHTQRPACLQTLHQWFSSI